MYEKKIPWRVRLTWAWKALNGTPARVVKRDTIISNCTVNGGLKIRQGYGGYTVIVSCHITRANDEPAVELLP